MAADFIPTTVKEITTKVKDPGLAAELGATLLRLQKQFPSIKDPLAIDLAAPKKCRITRKLTDKVKLADFNNPSSKVKYAFGEGSRGNRGVSNRGNLFEYELAKDIDAWWQGELVSSQENADIINGLVKEYKMDKWPALEISLEGANNNARPLQILGDDVIVTPGVKDIGKVVTDVTLKKKASNVGAVSQSVYLSLKYSGTVTFFNTGTKKFLPDEEIKSGSIKNKQGLALLKMFGLDNATFCSIFNRTAKSSKNEDVTRVVDKDALRTLIQSGIGFGYHMVHKNGHHVHSMKVDQAYNDKASNIKSVTVYYGGKTGTLSARVDIVVITDVYNLKFNFRNKQGGDFISHLMCDYTYIK